MNRDPIWEWGGLNLHAFLANNTQHEADYLGLRKITAGKCESYLFIGHTSESKPIEWSFDHHCSIGGVVACWPQMNNPTNSYHRWPRVPNHPNRLPEWAPRGNAATLKYLMEERDNNREVSPDEAEHNFDKALSNALSKKARNTIFDRLCNAPGCCAEVTFVIEIGKDKWHSAFSGTPIRNAVKRYGYEPGKTYRETLPCP